MSDPNEKRGSLFYPAEDVAINPGRIPTLDEMKAWIARNDESREACMSAHREEIRRAMGLPPQAGPVPPASPSSGE